MVPTYTAANVSNVISGNADGIRIDGASGNLVESNIIGLSENGTARPAWATRPTACICSTAPPTTSSAA